MLEAVAFDTLDNRGLEQNQIITIHARPLQVIVLLAGSPLSDTVSREHSLQPTRRRLPGRPGCFLAPMMVSKMTPPVVILV